MAKNRIYVRWLKLYGGHGVPLINSIDFELERDQDSLVACEPCFHGHATIKGHVGLLVARDAVYRTFRSDVYSIPCGEDAAWLKKTRPGSFSSSHGEAFVRPVFTGIVFHGNIRKDWYRTAKYAAKKYNLPMFRMKKGGKLVRVY